VTKLPRTPGLGDQPLPRVRGSFYTRIHNGILVAQKWPRRWKKKNHNADFNRFQLALATWLALTAWWSDIANAIVLARGTKDTWRDVLIQAIFGRLYYIVSEEGFEYIPNQYRSAAMAIPPAQFILDSITAIGGSILRRAPLAWEGVPNGAEGTVLTMIGGLPQWVAPTDIRSGVWTPTLTCLTPGDLSVAYDQQAGTWIKIARAVILGYQIRTTTWNWTTATGRLLIDGTPFTTGSATNDAVQNQQVLVSGIATPNAYAYGARKEPTGTTINLLAARTADTPFNARVTDTVSGAQLQLFGSCIYLTD
jgi:hypothetical protein